MTHSVLYIPKDTHSTPTTPHTSAPACALGKTEMQRLLTPSHTWRGKQTASPMVTRSSHNTLRSNTYSQSQTKYNNTLACHRRFHSVMCHTQYTMEAHITYTCTAATAVHTYCTVITTVQYVLICAIFMNTVAITLLP